VQADGERGLWIGTIVGVNIDCEPGNWVVRRELEPTIGKVSPLWIHSLNSGVASIAERIGATGSLWLGGTSFFCSQLVDNFQTDKCS
jgi:hypothetical protein